MRLMLIPVALLIGAAPAATQKREVPPAEPAGEAVDCITTSAIRSTSVRSDKVIDFMLAGGKVYRNELPIACPGLASEGKFLHKSSLNSYCSVDTITVLQSPPGIEGATCGLGKFQPVKLVKAR